MLPSLTTLLLPNFSWTTLIGLILVILTLFNNFIFYSIIKMLSLFIDGVNEKLVRFVIFIAGLVLIFIPSIIQDLLVTTDGKLLLLIIILVFVLVAIIINKRTK